MRNGGQAVRTSGVRTAERGGVLRGGNWALVLGLLAMLAAGGATCRPPEAKKPPAPEPLYSVAELPVEKFDQYPAGEPPPAPWGLSVAAETGVTVALDRDAESPFIANTVNGVGVRIADASATAGQGAGVRCGFAPPPPGPLFLAFDFKIDAGAETAAPTAVLEGEGAWTLSLSQAGKLGLLTADGSFQALADVKPGTWYHVGLSGDSGGGNGTLGLIAETPGSRWDYYLGLHAKPGVKGKAAYDVWTPVTLPRLGTARSIAFVNRGEAAAQGVWRFDNVLMAGRIDAPRAGWWPHDLPPEKTLRTSPKKVFAYYFPVYTSDTGYSDPGVGFIQRTVLNPLRLPWEKPLADYAKDGYAGYQLYQTYPHVPRVDGSDEACRAKAREEDVRIARAIGLDGFFVDFWANPHPKNGEATFSRDSFALLDAAQAVDPGFKIVPAFYVGGAAKEVNGAPDPQEYAASPLLRKALRHPSAYTFPDRKVALSSWLAERYGAAWWKVVLGDLEKDGFHVAFLPHFNSKNRLAEFGPISRGMAVWGARTPSPDTGWAKMVHEQCPLAINPVASQDVRVRITKMWEAANSEAFRRQWECAIREDADWVILNTWTDYSEQAQMPSTRIGYSFYDLNAYYIPWFKTGRAPVVARDVLYYFYRRQHTDAAAAMGKPWSFAQYDPKTGQYPAFAPRNDIELLAFLKAPGRLVVQIGGERHTKDAAAGMTSFKVPLPKGKEFQPVFSLERDGRTVLSDTGRYLVTDRIVFADLLYNGGVIAGR